MDKVYGTQLKKGFQYPAHLQQIPGNAHLCPEKSTWQNWNVTVPADGAPVALLVKKGICDDLVKGRSATKFIEPKGVVKYLIIDGDEQIKEDEEENYYDTLTVSPPHSVFAFQSFGTQKDKDNSLLETASMTPNTELQPASGSLRKKKKKDPDPIEVTMLHVTYGTGYDLLELIMREATQVRKEGGTTIILDANSPHNASGTVIFFWVTCAFFMALSACCCLTNAIGELLDASQHDANQPAVRPRRRRLTRDQVRANIPMGIFNGSELIFAPTEHAAQNGDENDELIPAAPPEPHSLEGCSICLDEYVSGEKLRCLPCQHTFHAKCIGKWLTERSATCPLCKIDLYESEDEEEEEETGTAAPNAAATRPTPNDTLATSWASVPPEAMAAAGPPEPAAAATTAARTEETNSSWFRRGHMFGAWGRSLFTGRAPEGGVQTSEPSPGALNDTLATPLLQDTANSDQTSADGQPAEPETTPEHEQPASEVV